MSLGVDIEIQIPPPKGRDSKWLAIADAVLRTHLTDAKLRIMALWPVDHSVKASHNNGLGHYWPHSAVGWELTRDGPFRYRMVNTTAGPSGEYAGYVYAKNDSSRTPLAETLVRPEIMAALRRAKIEITAAGAGSPTGRPSVRESLTEQLRAALHARLVAAGARVQAQAAQV